MSGNTSNPLKDLWRGAQWIGLGPTMRTAIYPLRLAWYRARFGTDSDGRAFTRSIPQAIRNLFMNKNAPNTPNTPSECIGDVIATKRLSNGIEVRCSNGLCTIEAITSRIMRVRVVREGTMSPYFSYATILDPQDVPLEIREGDEELVFSTPELSCHVRYSPFGLRMTDADGQNLMGGVSTIAWNAGGRSDRAGHSR